MEALQVSVGVSDRTVFGLDRRTVWPAVVVAAVVVTFGAIIPAVNHAVSPEESIEPGTVLDVGLGVSFTPVAGWLLNTDLTVPGTAQQPGLVSVSESGLLYTISVQAFDGTVDELMDTAAERRSDRVDKWELTSPSQSASTTQGVTGLSETYHGVGVQGSLTVFVSDGVAVVVDADGPEGSLLVHATEVDAMTQTITFDGSEAEQ
ncbi:MAG: hypothetical protein ACR2OH_03040 [Microthrixaceae bacterium]